MRLWAIHQLRRRHANFVPARIGPLVVAVHDRRREVVSGGKNPAYCGVFRGGFYNPFDVETAGDVPLADEFSSAALRAMSLAGFSVTSVPTTAHQNEQEIAASLAGKRALLIGVAADAQPLGPTPISRASSTGAGPPS